MFGVPPNTLPLVIIYRDNILVIYRDILLLGIITLYNVSFKTIAGGFNGAFWWYGPLSEDRENC